MNAKVPQVPMPVEVIELQGHLSIRHSYYIPDSDDDLGSLTEFHDEEHAGSLPIVHPHTHTAPEPEEEWSWEF